MLSTSYCQTISATDATGDLGLTSFCQVDTLIRPSRQDVLTLGTKTQIVSHNLANKCLCAQPRPAECAKAKGS